jgi:hypothetical protein
MLNSEAIKSYRALFECQEAFIKGWMERKRNICFGSSVHGQVEDLMNHFFLSKYFGTIRGMPK